VIHQCPFSGKGLSCPSEVFRKVWSSSLFPPNQQGTNVQETWSLAFDQNTNGFLSLTTPSGSSNK